MEPRKCIIQQLDRETIILRLDFVLPNCNGDPGNEKEK